MCCSHLKDRCLILASVSVYPLYDPEILKLDTATPSEALHPWEEVIGLLALSYTRVVRGDMGAAWGGREAASKHHTGVLAHGATKLPSASNADWSDRTPLSPLWPHPPGSGLGHVLWALRLFAFSLGGSPKMICTF